MSHAWGHPPKEEIEPQPLELSLNPEDGSLLTAPLANVLLTATDGLYQELYQMTHGELEVVGQGTADTEGGEQDAGGGNGGGGSSGGAVSTRRESLANLSFAQRRHEIAWRLAQHGRGLQHVAALCAAAASSDISRQVRVSSTALQHSRAAWVQADEAQDALYFFHAQLFPIRAAPHDVYGASDVLLQGRWLDLPTDLRLADPFETSRPAEWNKSKVQEEWRLAIRDKLLTGEVGWMRQHAQFAPWKIAIRGSRVQLTYGKPRRIHNAETRSSANNQETYPLSAWLTVLPIPDPDRTENDPIKDTVRPTSAEALEWSLLSLDVTVQAKTGEFNHQLDTSNRQRFDLHRLAAKAMAREEQRARVALEAAKEDKDVEPARPLNALFSLSHSFLLSWQLELLSAQALALRRGIWAAGEANPLKVTPIRFVDHSKHPEGLLGVLSISFWKVDDSYGPPTLSDLVDYDGSALPKKSVDDQKAMSAKLREHIPTTNQLILCIRADMERGIRVSVSGGSALQAPDTPAHCQSAARDLIEAASNPLALSASDALLAATRLCAEQKCQATVKALQKELPDWIELSLERCGIVVAASVQYHGIEPTVNHGKKRPILFRLGCDARTGSFVSLFSRNTRLLRNLAGNDLQASEAMAVRVAMLPQNRRRAARSDSSGRIARDAFDSLIRSMNVLGQRVGVGGQWDDVDQMSPSLRERNIGQACRDVRKALINACGIASLYGLAPLAIGAAFGLNAMPDMVGKVVSEKVDGSLLLNAPPVGILLDQQMAESSSTAIDGVSQKRRYLRQSFFAMSCTATENGVTIVPMLVEVALDSPVSPVERQKVEIIPFQKPPSAAETTTKPATKKPRIESSDEDDSNTLQEVDVFAEIVSTTHEAIQS